MSLTLRRHRPGLFPKPTVVIDGRGQPAQWGTGTWQVSALEPTSIRVFLFNRLWTYGIAEFVLGADDPAALVYSAPWLPFLAGRFSRD